MDYYVSELLELINSRASPPTDMSHYRLLLAKIDRYEGHIHSMHNNIAAAFEISPNDPFINWFRYQIAQDMGDTDAALKVLHKLEEYDPYNQYTLYEKMKIYTELQEWNRVIELGERILSQERHIEQHIKHEIIQLRTLASRKIE